MRISVGWEASNLYLPNQKQSLAELAWMGSSTLANSLVIDCKSFSR